MYRITTVLIAVIAATSAGGASAANDTAGQFRVLRDLDLRLATIAHRLTTANAPLCRDQAPAPGMVVHALSQYSSATRGTARQVFGFAHPLAVQAVVPGGPADLAGVRANDAVLAINGEAVPTLAADDNSVTSKIRDDAVATIARQPIARPLTLTVGRDGARLDVVIQPAVACRATVELLIGEKLFAQADSQFVQISSGYFERHDDDGAAVAAAHELAHVVLRHRARLEAAGVKRGFLAKFGRDRRITRRIEDEADQLSVSLLRNAGYNPMIAVRFWQIEAGVSGSGLTHRTHASPQARAAAIAAEIARIPQNASLPTVPPVLATGDTPLN